VFCVFRLISTALRIAWAFDQGNARLGVAEQAFINAGVAALYMVNPMFAHRIMRARQPWFGWPMGFTAVVWTSIAVTLATVIIIIVVVAQSFLAHGLDTLRIDRDLQLYALTWFVFVALLPTLVVLLALVLPRKSYIDKFGHGRFRWKLVVVIAASLILTLGASWRCGTTFASPLVQQAQRPWYFSSACFYVFTLMLEIIVLAIYLLTRVDQRFHVPDGASGPGSYSGGAAEEEKGPQWPEAVYLPVTQVHHSRNVNGPVLRQDFLQVDPRTGQYVLTNPQQQGSRTSMSSSVESRRGKSSLTNVAVLSIVKLTFFTSQAAGQEHHGNDSPDEVIALYILKRHDRRHGDPRRTCHSSRRVVRRLICHSHLDPRQDDLRPQYRWQPPKIHRLYLRIVGEGRYQEKQVRLLLRTGM